MAIQRRVADVPAEFGIALTRFTKADCVELLWYVMMQSPWFDGHSARMDPESVATKLDELRDAIDAQRS